MYVGLEGAAEDVDIDLSEAAVTLDSTYISLSSQRVIKVIHTRISMSYSYIN